MIIFYAEPVSLYCAKVRVALRAKGLAWREAAPPGAHEPAAWRALAPQATLPAIEDDGFVLADSEAILEYLDETRPDPAMLVGDARARAMQRALARFHDTRLEPALRPLFYRPRDPAGRALLTQRLEQLAALPRPGLFAGGADLGIGDCGFAVTFQWIEGIDVALPAALGDWRAALAAQPAVAAETAAYAPRIAAWVASKGGV